MNDNEKMSMFNTLVGENVSQDLAYVYLLDAKDSILRRIYNGSMPTTDMPKRYDILQVKLAVRYYLRRGAEGEILHSENGINRTYANVNDDDLLSQVSQCLVGVAK